MPSTSRSTESTAWSGAMQRLATDLGVAQYESGLFWFQLEGGPQIQVEPLEQGDAIALHAGFGLVPYGGEDEDTVLTDLLSANSPRQRGPVWAIDPVDGQAVLFQRFDDADITYEAFLERVRVFAARAAGGLEPRSLAQEEPAEQSGSIADLDAFRHVLVDFAFQRGFAPLAAEVADAGECLVALGGGGGVLIQFEPSSSMVLLKSVMGFLPMDEVELGNAQPGAFLRPLLEAHLLGEATHGACFAIDDQGGDLVAYLHLPLAGLDGFKLGEALDDLADVSIRIAEQINLKMPNLA